jgi:hypothetical protein
MSVDDGKTVMVSRAKGVPFGFDMLLMGLGQSLGLNIRRIVAYDKQVAVCAI